jgi:hypothetical protein
MTNTRMTRYVRDEHDMFILVFGLELLGWPDEEPRF